MFAKKSICAKEILEGGRISLHQRPTTSLIQMRRIHRENPVISGIKKQGISGPIFPGNPAENGKFKMLNQISKDRAKGKYRMKKSAIITSRPLMNNLKRLETKESLGQYFLKFISISNTVICREIIELHGVTNNTSTLLHTYVMNEFSTASRSH